ncbi:hypothetical protein WJX84_011136 [Apatococcus fuscideae]|uniref:SURF1-like protein n=1 Tax=Apatococcus fuscideae TaxID=2026836 RepID=A0AAW1T4S6_9CHLO
MRRSSVRFCARWIPSLSVPVVSGSTSCATVACTLQTARFSTSLSPSKHSSRAQADQKRWGFVLLVPAALSAALGCWQLARWRRKEELVAKTHTAFEADPISLTHAASDPAALKELTRISCEGKLLHERSILVGPRPRSSMGVTQPGFTLVTPLQGADGQDVLVNRGWVPAIWRQDAGLRSQGEPSGKVALAGVLRHSEKPSMFVPENEPAKGAWYWLDVPALALACDLPPDTPLLEALSEASESTRGPTPSQMDILARRPMPAGHQSTAESYPLQRATQDLLHFSVMPDDHRNYALTWFALSAAVLPLGIRALRSKRVSRHGA